MPRPRDLARFSSLSARFQVSVNNVNLKSHPEIYNNNDITDVPLASRTKTEADGYTNLLNTQVGVAHPNTLCVS